MRGGLDGGTGIGLSHRGRALLLGVSARRPDLGVDDGVAQHDRADHHHRRHQRRRGDLHRGRRHPHHGPAGGPGGAGVRDHDELVLLRVRDGADHDSADPHQHLRHPADGAAERLQRLLAHRRRGDHRPAAHRVRHPSQQPRFPVLPSHGRQSARRFLRGPGHGHASAGAGVRRLHVRLASLRALSLAGGDLSGGAVRAGLRARAAAGPVDLHGLRCFGPRRRRDGDGAEELRLGRLPVCGGVGGGGLRDADDPDLVHPERRRRRDGQRCLSGPPDRLRQSRRLLRQRRRDHHRRRDVAVRIVVDHVDGADVVRLRSRRRHARLVAHQAGEPDPPHARLVDPDHERAGRGAVPLCGGLLRDHVDQHDHALPGVHVPDLSQLAEPAAGAGSSPRRLRRRGISGRGARCST